MAETISDKQKRYRNVLALGLGAMILLSVLVATLAAMALNLQFYAQAYVAGESHWSKAIGNAVHHLDDYATHGRDEDLVIARQALSIPIGDLHAREALDRPTPDIDAAREGFIAGRNHPDDVDGMIFLFRYFAWMPGFDEAITVWYISDEYVLRLWEIADLLESLYHSDASPEEFEAVRAELSGIRDISFQLAENFSSAMLDGVRLLRKLLSGLTVIIALLFGVVAYIIFWRMMEWLRQRDRKFHAAFEQAGVGMAQVALDGYILDLNPALCNALRTTRQRLLGTHFREILHPDDLADTEQEKNRLLAGEARSFTSKKRYKRGDDSLIWAKLTAAMTRDDNGEPEQFLWIFEDVTESHELAQKLTYQVRHDDLTGLYNRREIERRLQLALDGAWRDGTEHVLFFIDVDQFKLVNDTCGHVAGDHLLRLIGEQLGRRLRDSDLLGRLGGDEYAIILHNTSLEAGQAVAEKLRAAMSAFEFHWEGRIFRTTMSIGVASINERTPDLTTTLRAADTACHIAKNHGRDRVHVYTESDKAVAEHFSSLEWLSNIQDALSENRLRLVAQRILPLADPEQGLSCEILVRLVGRDGTVFLPGAFLPAAERYGLMTEIDKQVLEISLAYLSRDTNVLDKIERLHINASGQSISSESYREFVQNLITASGFPGSKLCFEITETAAMTDLQGAHAFFEVVQGLGCCIAIDDFGSGLSSFGYLKNLPAEILKIDGVFVRDIATDPHDHAVVKAISEVARELGRTTIAEFVETDEILELLRGLGVDYAQGYAIHRPEPLEDLFS